MLFWYISTFLQLFSGPFWISATLVFSTAICGNLAKYIQTSGTSIGYQYGSDFRLGENLRNFIATIKFETFYHIYWLSKHVNIF